MKNVDIAAYTRCFNDLSIFCPSFVTQECKNVERYIWGLVQPIQGLVTTSRPTTYNSAKRLAFTLTNQVIRKGNVVIKTGLPGSGNSKIKLDEDSKQVTWKKQDLGKVYIATILRPTPLRQYAEDLPICNKCNYHHMGACRELICNNCSKKGHTSKSCRSLPLVTT